MRRIGTVVCRSSGVDKSPELDTPLQHLHGRCLLVFTPFSSRERITFQHLPKKLLVLYTRTQHPFQPKPIPYLPMPIHSPMILNKLFHSNRRKTRPCDSGIPNMPDIIPLQILEICICHYYDPETESGRLGYEHFPPRRCRV